MSELKSSSRVALKATYVIQPVTPSSPSRPAPPHPDAVVRVERARKEPSPFAKANFVRGLGISPRELHQLLSTMTGEEHETLCRLSPLIEGRRPEEQAALLPRLQSVPSNQLIGVARSIDIVRRHRNVVADKEGPSPEHTTNFHLRGLKLPNLGLALDFNPVPIELLIGLLNEQAELEPVGWLHLERIEMKPVGIERGELVGTIPMAPGESVRVSHKEWSTHSEELSRIVTDELETYAERGVEEKHDVSMSSENEVKRDTTLNFGVSISGGYGPVSMTSSLSNTTSTSERQARRTSANHAQQITQKASTRSRKEQKISFRIESKAGDSTESARLIENKNDKAIRVDYYRMMRKWRVDLIRYGLRMTYDLVVPDPGSSLRKSILDLAALDKQLNEPFQFDLPVSALDPRGTIDWQQLADKYGVAIEAPPAEELTKTISFVPFDATNDFNAAELTRFGVWPVPDLPPGYLFQPFSFRAEWTSWGGQPPGYSFFGVVNAVEPLKHPDPNAQLGGLFGVYTSSLSHLANAPSEHVQIHYQYRRISALIFTLQYKLVLTNGERQRWMAQAWQRFREAAEQRHFTELQRKREMRERLAESIAFVDTLSLRRAEHEELMKRTLQWLLGPDFDFDVSPDLIEYLIKEVEKPNETAPDQEQSKLALSHAEWMGVRKFGEFIKFLHHAVEWENLLYFLYPYFWGSSELAEVKRMLEHPNPFRREFLRAGAARVVLPIRPGFEERFAIFIETGKVPSSTDLLSGSSPYFSIAEEIRAFARTNYPGIVPANPDDRARARPLNSPKQQQAWDDMQQIVRAIEKYAEKKKQAEPGNSAWAGAPAESKYYPTETEWADANWKNNLLQIYPSMPTKDPWGNEYLYEPEGTAAPFRIVSLGAKGAPGGDDEESDISTDAVGNLIATWFEYTPTSGLDIEIDTKPADMA